MITPKEIIERAIQFSKDWKEATRENSDKQTFWNEFFHVFGIERKKIAKFEETVKKYSGKSGFVDLFWKGELIVEHKSKGEDLDDAYDQAIEYADGLKKRDKPKYIVVSDFDVFRIYDCSGSAGTFEEVKLSDFPKKTDSFGFISGYSRRKYKEEEPVNKEAAELIGNLHEAMLQSGYEGEDLERFLVRILFCLFADDTTIFQPKGIFREFIDEDTYEDGSNVGSQLIHLFQVLNTPDEKRQKTLSPELKAFPYVNGDLFGERLDTPSFDKKMRDVLLECCRFDWSEISPAIFGTMFQAIIHGVKRDELGAHYTSEGNILKVIHGLFLDELVDEFNKSKGNLKKLKEFHNNLATLKFFDPACGCGNFLVIAYREIRKLEIEILKQERALSNTPQLSLTILQSQIKLDSFYGIEYDKSAVRISEVAMWLMEHKMNEEVTREFSRYIPTIPLQASPNITCGNALRIDWNKTIPNAKLSYIFGNPPFVSQENRSLEQREDMKLVFGDGGAILDYVCAWYKKAADYIADTNIRVAFVSTNSITQGEQVGVLWEYLFKQNIKIHFAHRTFKWNNEAKGKASVYVVVVGFAQYEPNKRFLYDYATPTSDPEEIKVKRINPYLIDFDDVIITDRNLPISDVPKMYKGSQPTDGGNLLFTDEQKKEFLRIEPGARAFIKPFIGAHEYINGEKRWCLWLKDAEPRELRTLPNVLKRVAAVKAKRLESRKAATVKWAERPTEFTENRQPNSNYVLIPRHSSENRDYVPMGFFSKNDIAGDSCSIIPDAPLYLFGILTSMMHMAWMRQVCGRLESRYRYSNTIVYNNFPFPENVSKANKTVVEQKAQDVLNARKNHSTSSLADLYDPSFMPNDLRKAHKELDKAVDKCYGKQAYKTEMDRLKFLFGLYQQKTEPLLLEAVSKKKSTKPKKPEL